MEYLYFLDKKRCEEEEKSPPIMMILQLCCISAIEGMDAGLLPAVNYALQKDLGLRLTDLSVLTLAQAVAQALAAPIWGVLADRRVVRRKTLLCVGALFQARTVGVATSNQSRQTNIVGWKSLPEIFSTSTY